MFMKGSRYEKVVTEIMKDEMGREVHYKRIRFIPERRAQLVHMVREGERLDHIAFQYFKDPELFWLICDSNEVMWPDDLTSEKGKRIIIPEREG